MKVLTRKLSARDTIIALALVGLIVVVATFLFTLSQIKRTEYRFSQRVTQLETVSTEPGAGNNPSVSNATVGWNPTQLKISKDSLQNSVKLEFPPVSDNQQSQFPLEVKFDFTKLAEPLVYVSEKFGTFVFNNNSTEQQLEVQGFSNVSQNRFFNYHLTGFQVNALKIENGMLIIHYEDSLSTVTWANSTVVALDLFSGDQIWRTSLADALQMKYANVATNVIPQDKYSLFVPTRSTLYELDLRSGEVVKERQMKTHQYSQGIVHIWNSTLFYAEDDNTLVIEKLDGSKLPTKLNLQQMVPEWRGMDFNRQLQYGSGQGILAIPESGIERQYVIIEEQNLGYIDPKIIPFYQP